MTATTRTSLPFHRGWACIALTAALLCPAALRGADISFGQIITEGDRRFLELSVHFYQGTDILEAVKRGIEAKVTITVQIVREGALDFVFSSVASSATIKRSLRYDYWNRAYVIAESGKKTQFHGESAMFQHLFRVARYDLPGGEPGAGNAYRVRARAELKSVELYFPMNYIFRYIVGYWDFDTGWVNGPRVAAPR
ncbi:MAG TPA: DUF4390 domain-containing protein [Spirochaetota bacterium]|nr:DUF4390 domain-containing protein [Spirochaetota bacterium]